MWATFNIDLSSHEEIVFSSYSIQDGSPSTCQHNQTGQAGLTEVEEDVWGRSQLKICKGKITALNFWRNGAEANAWRYTVCLGHNTDVSGSPSATAANMPAEWADACHSSFLEGGRETRTWNSEARRVWWLFIKSWRMDWLLWRCFWEELLDRVRSYQEHAPFLNKCRKEVVWSSPNGSPAHNLASFPTSIKGNLVDRWD